MTNRPYPCAKEKVGSSTVSSSSVASSASTSSGSAAPTGTGCAYLGDSSFAPVTSESMSDSSGGVNWGVSSICKVKVPPQRDFYVRVYVLCGGKGAAPRVRSRSESPKVPSGHSLLFANVFGCELDLLELETQLPLPEAFHTALLQHQKLQIECGPAWWKVTPSGNSKQTAERAKEGAEDTPACSRCVQQGSSV